MTSLILATLTVCLFAVVYGGQTQYASSYFGAHNGYPYGPHGPYFPPLRSGRVGGGDSGFAGTGGRDFAAGGHGTRQISFGLSGGAGGPKIAGSGGTGIGEGAGALDHTGSHGSARIPAVSRAVGRLGHDTGGPRMGNGSAGLPGNAVQGGQFGTQPRRPAQELPQPDVYVNAQDTVASSVVRTTDQYFYKPEPVGFDKVITNINGGHNSEYGVFIAPAPGVYDIKYHVQTKEASPKLAHVDLTRNGEVVNSAKAKGNCASASNTAVLYLHQFDHLSVNGREGTVIGCEDNGLCSFSVSLVKLGKFFDQKIPRAVPMDRW